MKREQELAEYRADQRERTIDTYEKGEITRAEMNRRLKEIGQTF